MVGNETDGDDPILERLRESASSDPAMRQLRRRYDSLRADYEQLLDRLTELESRLNAEQPPVERGTSTQPPPPSAWSSLAEMVLAPLIKLRADYAFAVFEMNSIVAGLDSLAAGGFKGQRGDVTPTTASARANATQDADEAAPPLSRRVHLHVRGPGFGELLDFQERLSTLEGVAHVSINAIDTERATLVVELAADGTGKIQD